MTAFTFYAGKTHNITLTYKDSAGAPINIIGSTARLSVRKSVYSPVIFEVTAVIDGAAGVMVFTFEPVDTADIITTKHEETFVFGIEFIPADGDLIPFLEWSDLTIKQPAAR